MPLPTENLQPYHDWRVVFWIMFGGCCFSALVLIWKQAQLDFFFLDWEKSKNPSITADDVVQQAQKKGLQTSQLPFKASKSRLDVMTEKPGRPF